MPPAGAARLSRVAMCLRQSCSAREGLRPSPELFAWETRMWVVCVCVLWCGVCRRAWHRARIFWDLAPPRVNSKAPGAPRPFA